MNIDINIEESRVLYAACQAIAESDVTSKDDAFILRTVANKILEASVKALSGNKDA